MRYRDLLSKQALIFYAHRISPSQASNAKFGKVLRVTYPFTVFQDKLSYIYITKGGEDVFLAT